MGTYSKFKHKKEIEPNLFEIANDVFHDGGCQCFKDCDCCNNKGKFLFTDIRYSNGLVLREDGKERIYSSIEGCKASLKAYLSKVNHSTLVNE
jgi:hypothetical protein